MTVSPERLLEIVNAEVSALGDARVTMQMKRLLIEPRIVIRQWDYGKEDEEYPCWSVLEHPESNTGIAYCEHGFGPGNPWGLVFLSGAEHMSMGMDAAWYPKFLDVYFQSSAAAELPIWRVFQSNSSDEPAVPVSPEGDWESIWSEVLRLRQHHPSNHYSCGQSLYRGEA